MLIRRKLKPTELYGVIGEMWEWESYNVPALLIVGAPGIGKTLLRGYFQLHLLLFVCVYSGQIQKVGKYRIKKMTKFFRNSHFFI